jgi:hypothetical protein
MGLMYAWATKEYLLWEMTIGQIILYHNKGMKIKSGEEDKSEGLANKSTEELRKMIDNHKAQVELDNRLIKEKELSEKFGDIK